MVDLHATHVIFDTLVYFLVQTANRNVKIPEFAVLEIHALQHCGGRTAWLAIQNISTIWRSGTYSGIVYISKMCQNPLMYILNDLNKLRLLR